jgi:hypothetical protein
MEVPRWVAVNHRLDAGVGIRSDDGEDRKVGATPLASVEAWVYLMPATERTRDP